MLSLYVDASVVQSPPVVSNLCDGQGHVVLFEQASNTFYVTVDTVHTAAITAAIVPLLTMKHVSYPLLNAPDGFDAVLVQNVGSAYIIVSWDLPTHSNGIHQLQFVLQWCSGRCRAPYCDQLKHHRPPPLHFVHVHVLQSRLQTLHSSWNMVLGVISAAASLPRSSNTDDIVISIFINKIINPDKSFGSSDPMCILLLQLSSLLVELTAPNIHDSNKYCCLCLALTATTKPTRADNHCPG
ncbi:hypothetical protein EMCRGX_G014670 [Ephydatia muelleri]